MRNTLFFRMVLVYTIITIAFLFTSIASAQQDSTNTSQGLGIKLESFTFADGPKAFLDSGGILVPLPTSSNVVDLSMPEKYVRYLVNLQTDDGNNVAGQGLLIPMSDALANWDELSTDLGNTYEGGDPPSFVVTNIEKVPVYFTVNELNEGAVIVNTIPAQDVDQVPPVRGFPSGNPADECAIPSWLEPDHNAIGETVEGVLNGSPGQLTEYRVNDPKHCLKASFQYRVLALRTLAGRR